MTIKRATEFLGLTSNAEVESLIPVGKLPAVELPHLHEKKTWRIHREDLVKYDDYVKQKRREYIEKIQSEIND